MARHRRVYSPMTLEAARLLGARVRLARLQRRWTLDDLAERIGVHPATAAKIERGDPSVGLGVAFEAASLLGVALFDSDDDRRAIELSRISEGLALLPRRARTPRVDDDF